MSSMTQGTHMATLSPAQIDPFYSQGEELKLLNSDDILDSHWVTVFGFPPNATSYIIEQFSQYGTIIRHEVLLFIIFV
jgi:nuclear pore complex protein Nup53